jgi:hypothetical protein
VLHDGLEPFAAQKLRTEDDPDAAAAIRDGAQGFVVDIAPMREDADDAGMRDHWRPSNERTRLVKAFLIDVREVDDDALILAASDYLASERR